MNNELKSAAVAELVAVANGKILRGIDHLHLSDMMRWAGAPNAARWAIESCLRPEDAQRALALWK